MENKRTVVLIESSAIVAKGLGCIFSEMGEFRLGAVLDDLSHSSILRLHQMDADVVILDPSVLGASSRASGRNLISEHSDAACVALLTGPSDEDTIRSFDATISLMDSPAAIVRKLRSTLEGREEGSKPDSGDLSSREKEILICVAKGMLNKEIADLYNISIYTVITHRKNITRKTGIKTVAGLTVYALLNNLIDINSVE